MTGLTDERIREFVRPIDVPTLAHNMAGVRRFAGAGLTSLTHSIIVGELADPRWPEPAILGCDLHDAVDGIMGDVRLPFKTPEQALLEGHVWAIWMQEHGFGAHVEYIRDWAPKIKVLDDDAGDAEYEYIQISVPPGHPPEYSPRAMDLTDLWARTPGDVAESYFVQKIGLLTAEIHHRGTEGAEKN